MRIKLKSAAVLALACWAVEAAAQDGPVVTIIPPPPPISAGPAQAGTVSSSDQALAAKGAAPFKALISVMRLELDGRLLDYQTARFKSVALGYRDGKQVICGLYNAKNRMGAYSGWAVFYGFTGDAPRIVILGADEEPAFSYDYHCGAQTAWLPGDWTAAVAP